MEKLRFEAALRSGVDRYDYGIREIELLQGADSFAVFTSTGAYGGMAGYRLSGQGSLLRADRQGYSPSGGAALFVEMTLIEEGNAAQMLVGGLGAGRLDGGKGDDVLKGGAGADKFVFARGNEYDRIIDFGRGSDKMLIDNDFMKGQRNGRGVMDAFSEVTPEGLVLDFGRGDVLLIEGYSNVGGLAGAIEFF